MRLSEAEGCVVRRERIRLNGTVTTLLAIKANTMRTTVLLVLLALTVGCDRPEIDIPAPTYGESESTKDAAHATAASGPVLESHHGFVKGRIEYLTGYCKTIDGDDLDAEYAERILAGTAPMVFPPSDDPHGPRIEAWFQIPTASLDLDSTDGWSFVKATWETPPDEAYDYAPVVLEGGSALGDLVTPTEAGAMGESVVRLADQYIASGVAHLQSRPVLLKSGYIYVFEFSRSPDGTVSPVQEALMKFAPKQK